MGFEGRRKPPEFVINAAMAEDATALHELASAGGKAAARNKAERKRIAAEQEEKEQARIKEEREIFEEEERRIIQRDAKAHGRAFPAPDED